MIKKSIFLFAQLTIVLLLCGVLVPIFESFKLIYPDKTIIILLIPLIYFKYIKKRENSKNKVYWKGFLSVIFIFITCFILFYFCAINMMDLPRTLMPYISPLLILLRFTNAFIEEYVFRVTLFKIIEEKVSSLRGVKVLLSSLVFALFHPVMGGYGVESTIMTLVGGLVLGYIYSYNYNFYYLGLLHFCYNILNTILMGYTSNLIDISYIILLGEVTMILIYLYYKKVILKKYSV